MWTVAQFCWLLPKTLTKPIAHYLAAFATLGTREESKPSAPFYPTFCAAGKVPELHIL